MLDKILISPSIFSITAAAVSSQLVSRANIFIITFDFKINLRYNQGMKSLLQTREWAALRQGLGWQAHQINEVYVLQKKLPLGKSFLYAPEVVWQAISPEGGIGNFLENVKKIGRNSHSPLGTIFFRLEILDEFNEKIVEKLKNCRFVKSFEDVQPEWRQILDISQSEEEILAQMKPKGRYNIRVAQRTGIVIEKSNNIDDFYKIFCQTAKRDGFE